MMHQPSPAPGETEPAGEHPYHYRLSWRCDRSPGIAWRLTWLTGAGEFLADFGVTSPDPMRGIATSVRDTAPATRWRRCREILSALEPGGKLTRRPAFAVLAKVKPDE